jgi:peptidoglycan/LPS O-acetylase OafA/YrhL
MAETDPRRVLRLKQCFHLRENWRALWVPPPGNIAVLDGVRALSILYVLLFHCYLWLMFLPNERFVALLAEWPVWLRWVWQGGYGVDAFFVLSGYLITGLLIKEHDQTGRLALGRFYWRRFMRLMPVYLLAIWLFYGSELTPYSDTWWYNALYINNFLPFRESYMNWTWSLAIEMQFYLLFPLFLLGVVWRSRRPLGWLVGAYGVSFLILLGLVLAHPQWMQLTHADHLFPALASFSDSWVDAIYTKPWGRYGALMVGVLLAWLMHSALRRERIADWLNQKRGRSAVLLMIALLGMGGIVGWPAPDPQVVASPVVHLFYAVCARNLFALGVGGVLLVILLGQGRAVAVCRSALSWRGFYPLSQLAYSIYLLHLIWVPWAFLLAHLLWFGGPSEAVSLAVPLLALPILTLLSMLSAALAFLLVERPFMRMR